MRPRLHKVLTCAVASIALFHSTNSNAATAISDLYLSFNIAESFIADGWTISVSPADPDVEDVVDVALPIGNATASATGSVQSDGASVVLEANTFATATAPPSPSAGFASTFINSQVITFTNTSDSELDLIFGAFAKWNLYAEAGLRESARASAQYLWDFDDTDLFCGGGPLNFGSTLTASNGEAKADADVSAGFGLCSDVPSQRSLSISTKLFLSQSSAISAVPEPGAWLVFIAGFGLAGTALRRAQYGSFTPGRPA